MDLSTPATDVHRVPAKINNSGISSNPKKKKKLEMTENINVKKMPKIYIITPPIISLWCQRYTKPG